MLGQTISHYKILEKLGEGGMGVVYKAEDTTLKREVALKFLPPELTFDTDARSRFVREAQAASALDHPNIAVVHEIDETADGRSFICMGYYPGETLKEKIRRGPLGIDETVGITIQIAEALRRAHGAGIIHRDIKPANVLVTDEGVVKILDFGLAKLRNASGSTKSGRRAGTAAYMSPEQIEGLDVDERSDLFSLGVLLYEMLAGVQPFVADHEAALFYSILNLDPVPLSKLRPEISSALETVVNRLLEKDRSKRCQSAADVITNLRSTQSDVKALPLVGMVHALRNRQRMVLLICGVVVFAGMIIWLASIELARHSFHFEPSTYVLVADFENQTQATFFNHSLTEAMKVALRQSPHLKLFPANRIPEALQRMQLPTSHRLDESTALLIARREGAQLVVAGGIGQVGAGYSLTCKMIDAVSGDVLDLMHGEVPTVDRVLSGMDDLCKNVRQKLGESLPEISRSAKPLEQATTSSLRALEFHSRAMQLEAEGNYRDAAILEEQAIGEDSLFAVAVSEISYLYRKLGNDSLALYYHHRVLPLIGRVTDPERFYILTIYYGPNFELDFPRAYENIEQWTVRYPNDAEAFSELGWLAMYDGNTSVAADAFQHSLALDSTQYAIGSLYNNWGFLLALGGDGAGALPYLQRSRLIRPTYKTTDIYLADAYWMMGEVDSAEQMLGRNSASGNAREQIDACMKLGSLYQFEGRVHAAREQCTYAIAFCQKHGLSSDEAYFHYLLGELAAATLQPEVYAEEMKRAEALCRSPYVELPLIGSSFAQHGRLQESRRIVNRIRSLTSADPYFLKRRDDYLHLVQGEIMMAERTPQQAQQAFRGVNRAHAGDPIHLLAIRGMARAAVMGGDTIAVHFYRDLLERRGEAVSAFVRSVRLGGFWTRQLWPDAEFEVGKLYLMEKDTLHAREHLERCVSIWAHADPDDRPAYEATMILRQLTKSQ